MGLKTLYFASVVLCVLGSVVSVYSTEGQSGSPHKAFPQRDKSQPLKRVQAWSLSEHCPLECDCNPNTLECSMSVIRGSLTEVPDRLGSYPKARQAKTLNFEGSSITRISDGDFLGLSRAETLNLRHNRLEVVTPDAFEGLNSLRQLYLDYNKIGELPTDVFDPLVNLRVLDLSHNELTLDDPEETPFLTSHGLPAIQTLNLSNNAILTIWEYSLVGLEQLTTLILDDNPLEDVQPDVFARLLNLEELSLVDVGLQPEVLLRELDNLPNLQRIHLGNDRDECSCAWVKLMAMLKKQGVAIVEQDTPECSEGDLKICTEPSSAARKDDIPNSKKAAPVVKLSWKSVSYGAPSEKHSRAQIPQQERRAKIAKPKTTMQHHLVRIVKDRLLHKEDKESVASETDALPWWNSNKMKTPVQNELHSSTASEKSPVIFPWWHPDYVRASPFQIMKSPIFQGSEMMKSPILENEVEKEQPSTNVPWWHPDYVRLPQGSETTAGALDSPFGPKKSPTSTGLYKTPVSQGQSHGMPSRTENRNGNNRAKSRVESYPSVLKSPYGSPHRDGNSVRPKPDARGSRNRRPPAIRRPHNKDDYDKERETQLRPAIRRPPNKDEYYKERETQLSSNRPRYSQKYPKKYLHGEDQMTQFRYAQNKPLQNTQKDHEKDLYRHHDNVKNILAGIKKTSLSLGRRKLFSAVGNGRKTGQYDYTKTGSHTNEVSQRQHGSRGGNEWLYNTWKGETYERDGSERGSDGSRYERQYGIPTGERIAAFKRKRPPSFHGMEEQKMEDDLERLREKVRRVKSKVHYMRELEEERRNHGGKKPVSVKSKTKGSDSREKKYLIPILLPITCVIAVLIIALLVKYLSRRRRGAQAEEGDDQDWLSKLTKKATKKVKKPIWALGRGAKQLKTNRKQAMSLAGDQEDSEDEELFDVKREPDKPFKAYRKSRTNP
ncbi:uncharacterized protein [Branchiostoma lanceolatum]|uniref:uncharacterized protein n=1 Tax=Branchiostoma lanceolatum TaxID=7740 RepID=UPI0034548B98